MSDEMPAPVSAAPPAATDHEFSSHQEQPLHLPMHSTSRKSTLSKSIADVHVTGTQTPMSGMKHSHFEVNGLEEYFVCIKSFFLPFDLICVGGKVEEGEEKGKE
jgi:hypothetical protein